MSAPTSQATARQLRYLRELAARSATTFTYPATRRQASAEIARLRALPRQPRERSRGQYDGDLGYATAVQPHEVTGYGGSASWASRGGDGR